MPERCSGDPEILVDPAKEDIVLSFPDEEGGGYYLVLDVTSAEALIGGLKEGLKIMAEFRSLPGAEEES